MSLLMSHFYLSYFIFCGKIPYSQLVRQRKYSKDAYREHIWNHQCELSPRLLAGQSA